MSLAAYVKGFLEYKNDSHIQGVIFNQMSPMLYPRMKKLLEEGKEITDNRVTIRVTDSACISSGVLEIVEKTGKEVPWEKP